MAPLPQLQVGSLGLWQPRVLFAVQSDHVNHGYGSAALERAVTRSDFPFRHILLGIGRSEDLEYVLCCGEDNVLTGCQASFVVEEKPKARHLCFPPSCRTRTV